MKGDDLLIQFLNHWDALADRKLVMPLDRSEKHIVQIFSEWVAETFELSPKLMGE